jgi:hypothetical protein
VLILGLFTALREGKCLTLFTWRGASVYRASQTGLV